MIDMTPFTMSFYGQEFPVWNKGGWKYATNRMVCVRVLTDEPDTDISGPKKYPDAAAVFAEFPRGAELNPWPALESSVEVEGPCSFCRDTGSIKQTRCPECKGEGVTVCVTCRHEDECDECGGHGYVGGEDCPDCGGSGSGSAAIECDGLYVRIDNDRKIRALPGVRFCSAKDAIYFLFDGGEGVVMPLNVEAYHIKAKAEGARR